MRRVLAACIASVVGLGSLLASPAPVSADAPLCLLAPDFERQSLQSGTMLGAAVIDLDAQTIWRGGVSGPYAMHSMVKPPIAWALMTEAHEDDRELTALQRDAVFYMVAWSLNADVNRLLGMIGGLSGLNGFYERWGVPELAALQHSKRWGSGRAEPVDLARLYAALAVSPETPEPVRAGGFDLLRAVVDQHIWGASIPERRLVGWESLIKTGNFTLPELADQDPNVGIDPRDPEAESILQERDEALEAAEAAEAAEVSDADSAQSELADDEDDEEDEDVIVRMNSAAIWLEAPWLGGRPRFVVAIMLESSSTWTRSRALQNEVGATLGHAIADRLLGRWQTPTAHCLKRALY